MSEPLRTNYSHIRLNETLGFGGASVVNRTSYLRFFLKLILSALLGVFISFSSYAQTVVTPATGGGNLCVGGGYTLLGDITISEGLITDFGDGANQTYIISTPANFRFNVGASVVLTHSSGGGTVTNILPPVITTTTVTFEYDMASTATLAVDVFTISGLEVRAITPASSGNILRSGGTATHAGNGIGTQNQASLTSGDPPSVVTDPTDQAICEGSNAVFSATKAGTGTTYQWQEDIGAGFVDLGGQTSNILNLFSVPFSSNGNKYRVKIAGICAPVAYSASATLTVNKKPLITTQPTDKSVCEGTNVTFVSGASGTGVTLQWESGGGPWNPIAGETGPSLVLPSVTTGMSGNQYRLIATGVCSPVAISNVATLTVNPYPIIVQQADLSACPGAAQGIINFTTDIDPVTSWSWNVTNSVLLGMASGSGVTDNIPAFTYASNTTGSDIVGIATVTATKNGCTSVVMSFTITLKAEPIPNAVGNVVVCPGDAISVGFIANTGGGEVFSWDNSSAAIGIPLSGTGNIAYSAPNNLTGANIVGTITLRATKNACTTTVPNEKTFTITIKPSPVVAVVTDVTVCSGGAIGAINFSANTGGGETFNWTNDNAGIGLALSGSGNIAGYAAPVNTSGVPIVGNLTVTGTLNSCTGPVRTFKITINPEPVVAAVANQSYCPGDAASIMLSSNVVGSTISWTNSNTGIGIGASGSGDIIFTAPNNLTGAAIVGTIVVTSSSNGCTSAGANSKTFTITIKPSPVVAVVTDVVVCKGATIGPLALSANTFPATTENFSWIGGASVGLVNGSDATAPYEIPSFVATNGGTTPLVVTVSITSTLNSCTGPIRTFNITVNPTPTLAVTDNTSGTICSNSQTDISVSDLVSGSVIKLVGITISGAPGNITGHSTLNSTFASGSRITDLLVNTTTANQTIKYDFQSTANGCSGSIQSVTITVRPRALFTFTNTPSTICEGPVSQTNIVLSSSTVGMRVRISNITATGGLTGFSPIGTQFNAFPSTIANVLDNPTNQPQTVTYELEGSLAGLCINPTITNVTVTVNPRPSGAMDSKTVCSDTPINYSLLLNIATMGNNVSSTFSWVAADNVNPLVTGESTVAVVGPNITDVITNLTNSNQIVVYTVTPIGTNGCTGATFQITVTVQPEPVGVSATAPAICSNTSVNYNLQTNVNTLPGNSLASNFTWTATPQPNVTGETTSLKSGNIIDDVLVNTTTVNQVVVYTVTPTGQVGGCLGNQFTINVNVNPKAVFSSGPDLSVCVTDGSKQLMGTSSFAPGGLMWSGGTGGFSNSTIPNPVYTLSPGELAVTSPLNVTLTLTAFGAGACPTVIDQMVLTINPRPIVVFTGFPAGAPPQMAENNAPITLTGNQIGGVFTILPATSNIGSTSPSPVDKASFDPGAVTIGSNFVTYTYTNSNGCTNSNTQEVIVNPVTNVDFTMQYTLGSAPFPFVPLNGLGEFELCANVGLVKLLGNPAASTGLPPETQFTSIPAYGGGPVAPVSFDGTNYFIQTSGLVSDRYRILYTYKNAFNAITTKIRDIKIFASPAVLINVTNSCIDGPIVFMDGSTLPASPFPGNINGWSWQFGDGASSVLQNPGHTYSLANTYNVTLTAFTDQGCSSAVVKNIRVGDVPIVDYSWSAICNNDSTKFVDLTNPGAISVITTYTWDFGDGDVLVGPAGGTIPIGTNGGRTSGTYKNPDHIYGVFGNYNTKLTVDTNDGCNNSLPQKVTILQFKTVAPTSNSAYFQDFENIIIPDSTGWIPSSTALSDTSWIFGIPTGVTINSAASGANAWWTGKNSNSYYSNEKSMINGPCFDLRALNRPMIALDYWSDMENNVDGTVLQYSTDGGLNWAIVGPQVGQVNRDEGINWFNGVTIPSNPGQQPLGSYGWTDKLGSWKNGRFNLDMIPIVERDQVRLRLAFASNDFNATGKTYDGFAFDNVFVGNKQRNVLVEHFTNTNLTASTDGDVYLDGLLNAQITAKGVADFNDLRYHISFPTPDPLNLENPTDPGARGSYYNVSQSPSTIMDGILDGVKFKGRYLDITNVEIDRRALVDPLFELVLDTIATNNRNTITARLSITATKAFASPLIAQVALVEKNVAGSKNVVRKQLFGADGATISTPWTVGQNLNQSKANVEINVPIVNSNQLMLVGYVQDKNTKEIYQSIAISAPIKKGSVVVGLEDDEPLDAIVSQLNMYPNPANGEVNFDLPPTNFKGYTWRIADQRGVIMNQGDFDTIQNGTLTISVLDLPNGIYHVIITGKNNSATYKKLVVMNRN